MKKIILDSGPIISLALNNLLWLFEKCKKDYGIDFCLTEAVKKEVVDNPLSTKKFKFEALQVVNLIHRGILEVISDPKIDELTSHYLKLANQIYYANKRPLNLVHYAELSAVSASIIYNIPTVMIDERTTRYLFEKPMKLRNVISHKLHNQIHVNKKNLLNYKNTISRTILEEN